MTEPKTDLHDHLRAAREVVVWKLDGLTERDIRRPMTPTGTNLLGLVKHLATVELAYFSLAFGRPFPDPVPWYRPELGPDAVEPNSDLWATEAESREFIVDIYQRVGAHSDAIIDELPLDATGFVPWWSDADRQANLHRVLAHVLVEVHRHAGHADIVREMIDGVAGHGAENSFLPPVDGDWWASRRSRLEALAALADDQPG